jgi:hypothetical protein
MVKFVAEFSRNIVRTFASKGINVKNKEEEEGINDEDLEESRDMVRGWFGNCNKLSV